MGAGVGVGVGAGVAVTTSGPSVQAVSARSERRTRRRASSFFMEGISFAAGFAAPGANF